MKINEISLRVIFNTGNYENHTYEITAALEEGEAVDYKPLKKIIEEQHAALMKPSREHEPAIKKIPLVFDLTKGSTFLKVCEAVRTKRATIDDVVKHYELSKEGQKYLLLC